MLILYISCLDESPYYVFFSLVYLTKYTSWFLCFLNFDRLLNRDYTEEENAATDEAEEDGFLKAFKVCGDWLCLVPLLDGILCSEIELKLSFFLT